MMVECTCRKMNGMGLLYVIFIFLSIVTINFSSAQQTTKPHIIFILADDLGWNDVAFHGSEQIPTPNIDALASRGIILNNYYVAPICSPSRSALLTGKHPIHTGMHVNVIYGMQPYGLPLSEMILPEHLKDLGYVNHMVGKWHQGFFKSEYTPLYRGFDSHFGYYCGHQDYYSHEARESEEIIGFDMRRNLSLAWDTVGKYSTTLFTEEAVNNIENHDTTKPLFLYVAELAPHAGNIEDPIQPPAEYEDKFSYIEDLPRRKFAAVMTALDESVGNITLALINKGMIDNSIIIFSTDNGGAAGGYNSNAASNWPLKGTKDTLWEGGVRGSACIWSPLLHNISRVSDQLMTIEDWLPTLYSAAGGNYADLGPIDGVDMWAILDTGAPSPKTEILHNIDDARRVSALRSGDYKIVLGWTYRGRYDDWFGPSGEIESDTMHIQPQVSALNAHLDKFQKINDEDYKSLIQQAVVKCGEKLEHASKLCYFWAPCLYNIVEDPCEYHNIAHDHPDVVEHLLERLDYYRSTSVPPRNRPSDPNSNPEYHGNAWVPWKDATPSNSVWE